MNFSLHLCGSVIDRYLQEDNDIIKIANKSNRIQLNINIDKYSDYDKLSDSILEVSYKYNHHIILQQNKSKKQFNDIILSKAKNTISLLNDDSCGFGKVINDISPVNALYFTGYAGGICPDNVLSIVKAIDSKNNMPYYIDMESGIRNNDLFTLEKCSQVITNLKSLYDI